MKTRDKILQDAVIVFNKNGYSGISLFELAKNLGISRGHLTYYFKSKDDLLEAITAEMWSKIQKERAKSRKLPSFENLHNEAQRIHRYQKQYAFIYLDSQVFSHPTIREQFKKWSAKTIRDNEAAIAFAIQLGNMKKEEIPGLYKNIAFMAWLLAFYWLPQQVIRGVTTSENAENMIWSLLLPHFTSKGKKAFEQFFGPDHSLQLGEPFSSDLSQIISI